MLYILTILNYTYPLKEGDDGMCGTTRWKAAKAASKTMPNLDETGIVTGGCRHVIAQKAVNMFRGEMYVCNVYIILFVNYFHYTDMATLIIYTRKYLPQIMSNGCGKMLFVNIGVGHRARIHFSHSREQWT